MGCGSGLNLFSNIAMDGSNGIYRYFNMLLIIGISLFQNKGENDSKGIALKNSCSKRAFNICSFAIMILLVVVYAVFWK
jgi:SSS family solute:Na+ symporter